MDNEGHIGLCTHSGLIMAVIFSKCMNMSRENEDLVYMVESLQVYAWIQDLGADFQQKVSPKILNEVNFISLSVSRFDFQGICWFI